LFEVTGANHTRCGRDDFASPWALSVHIIVPNTLDVRTTLCVCSDFFFGSFHGLAASCPWE
jgi:hypothetical protein